MKILAIIIGVVILSVSSLNIINKIYKTDFNKLDGVDKSMFKELANVYNQFEENGDKLWDATYKLNEKSIILIRTYRDGGILRKCAYAINIPEISSKIYSKLVKMPENLNLPDVYRISNLNLFLGSTYLPSNFGTVNINDEEIFFFKYNSKMMENPELYFDFSSFMLHESFHTYKQKAWRYDLNDGEYIENYPYNKEYYALMGLEFALLDKAMEADDVNLLKEYLRQWTIIRSYKYEKWPQTINETNTEAIEGTARYIEYKYSQLTGGRLRVLANRDEPYYVTFSHAFNCVSDGIGETPSYLDRSMRYETGSALGLLMDSLDIQWKQKIEDSESNDGRTQYEILKNYFEVYSLDFNEINKIKADNNYEELLKKGEKLENLTTK